MRRLIPADIYCCDADALIEIDRANLLNQLRKLAQQDRLKIPRKVYAELRRGTGKLGSRLATWSKRHELIIDLDYTALTHLPGIERAYGQDFNIGGVQYPGLWRSSSGRRSADAQVVALAKARGWIVISNDRSIRGACLLEGIQCSPWETLALALHRL